MFCIMKMRKIFVLLVFVIFLAQCSSNNKKEGVGDVPAGDIGPAYFAVNGVGLFVLQRGEVKNIFPTRKRFNYLVAGDAGSAYANISGIIYRLKGTTITKLPLSYSPAPIAVDNKGHLWRIDQYNNLQKTKDATRWETMARVPAVASRYRLAFDSTNTLHVWVGNSLYRWAENEWKQEPSHVTSEFFLSSDLVQGKDKMLYSVSEKAVYQKSKENWGLLLEKGEGKLTFGRRVAALINTNEIQFFGGYSKKLIPTAIAKSANHIKNATLDNQDRLWVVTDAGTTVLQKDGEVLQHWAYGSLDGIAGSVSHLLVLGKGPDLLPSLDEQLTGKVFGSVLGLDSEKPLANVDIQLCPPGAPHRLRADDTKKPCAGYEKIWETKTNSQGIFSFDDVVAGEYKVALRPAGTKKWMVNDRLQNFCCNQLIESRSANTGRLTVSKGIMTQDLDFSSSVNAANIEDRLSTGASAAYFAVDGVGLFMLRHKKIKNIFPTDKQFQSIIYRDENSAYVNTDSVMYKVKGGKVTRIQKIYASSPVAVGKRGHLWRIDEYDTLKRIESATKSKDMAKISKTGPVRGLAFDDTDTLHAWVGNYLYLWKNRRWRKESADLGTDTTRRGQLIQGKDKALYLLSQKGVFRKAKETWQRVRKSGKGKIIFGGQRAALVDVNEIQFFGASSQHLTPSSIEEDATQIRTATFDNQDRLWVVTDMGTTVLQRDGTVLQSWSYGMLNGIAGSASHIFVSGKDLPELPDSTTQMKGRVFGVVANSDGKKTLSNAEIKLCPFVLGFGEEKNIKDPCLGRMHVWKTKTNEQGEFAFDDVLAGKYYVTIRPESAENRSGNIPLQSFCCNQLIDSRLVDMGTLLVVERFVHQKK